MPRISCLLLPLARPTTLAISKNQSLCLLPRLYSSPTIPLHDKNPDPDPGTQSISIEHGHDVLAHKAQQGHDTTDIISPPPPPPPPPHIEPPSRSESRGKKVPKSATPIQPQSQSQSQSQLRPQPVPEPLSNSKRQVRYGQGRARAGPSPWIPPTVCRESSAPTEKGGAEVSPPLPYHIARSHFNSLPVYTDYKRGGSLLTTTVRKVSGNLTALRQDLIKDLQKSDTDVKINWLTGHVVVKGHCKDQIEKFLVSRGV